VKGAQGCWDNGWDGIERNTCLVLILNKELQGGKNEKKRVKTKKLNQKWGGKNGYGHDLMRFFEHKSRFWKLERDKKKVTKK